MKSYKVEILPNAKKQLKKLDKKLSEKILVEIYKMARDPFACTQVKKTC
jgi:mRNA-degrading endonuclease RelE of RelBE toxin-antitoxin system